NGDWTSLTNWKSQTVTSKKRKKKRKRRKLLLRMPRKLKMQRLDRIRIMRLTSWRRPWTKRPF
ncbi:hypothetical protein KEM54_001727, partial [Ascosphaera aggregata]